MTALVRKIRQSMTVNKVIIKILLNSFEYILIKNNINKWKPRIVESFPSDVGINKLIG